MHIQIRIHLKHKENKEKLCIYPKIYDERNGLMNYPVDLDEWIVEKIERNSEVKDILGKDIFEGDKIYINQKIINGEVEQLEFIVFYENGAFRYDNGEEYKIINKELVQGYQVKIVERFN